MRFVKQFIYGVLYLAILFGIGYGLYASGVFVSPTCFDNRQNQGEEEVDCGGPCISCAIRKLKPLQVTTQAFGLNSASNAIFTFANPNIEYGARSFSYTVNFYNRSGQLLLSLNRASFIYPAEAEKVVIEPNLRINPRDIASQPEVVIDAVDWKPVAEFEEPRVQTRQVKTEISGTTATVSGILANRESFVLSRATVGAIVSDLSGKPVGASKTILQNLQPFEERAFNIAVPLNAALKLPQTKTQVVWEVQR